MQKTALKVSGIVFLLVGVLHVVRLIFKWEVLIAGYAIPMWVSMLGFTVPFLLALWMFKSAK